MKTVGKCFVEKRENGQISLPRKHRRKGVALEYPPFFGGVAHKTANRVPCQKYSLGRKGGTMGRHIKTMAQQLWGKSYLQKMGK